MHEYKYARARVREGALDAPRSCALSLRQWALIHSAVLATMSRLVAPANPGLLTRLRLWRRGRGAGSAMALAAEDALGKLAAAAGKLRREIGL